MEIVDREQERYEKENSPEGKRKKWKEGLVGLVIAAVCCVVIYVLNHNPAFTGTPHEVTLGDTVILPGSTTVQELYDKGYDFSDLSAAKITQEGRVYKEVFDISSEAEARTYYYSVILVKDEKGVATLDVVNEQSKAVPLSECKVRSVRVYVWDEGAENAALDGFLLEELSVEKLSETAGKARESSDGSSYTWEKGNYSMTLNYDENGSLQSFISFYEKQ